MKLVSGNLLVRVVVLQKEHFVLGFALLAELPSLLETVVIVASEFIDESSSIWVLNDLEFLLILVWGGHNWLVGGKVNKHCKI